MLKTGLMTWFTYNNYGTVLQLYALNSVIKQLGFDNEIINYIPKRPYKDPIIHYILKHPFLFANEIIFRANNLIYRKYKHLLSSKIEKFDSFKKSEFSFSKECRTASELFQLNDRYDIFICGSDQIWNPLCFDEKYFLDYVNETRKMIAYAPSIGVDNITNKYIAERMRKLISRFEKLSVREDAGKDIIYNISKKNAQQVLDPTLLLGKDEWEDLLDDKADYVHDEKYILCYFLGNSKKHWNIVKRLSKKMNLPINVIPNTSKDYARPFNIISDVGPRDFIRLVRKAHIICTDSFHGTIFSIIFNKLFFTFPRFRKNDPKNQNSRIYCLLKSLSLEDRLIFNQRNALSKINEIVNFAPVHEILNKERKKSINYLSKSLSSIDTDLSKKEDGDFIITNTCCGCGACASMCTNQAVKVGLNENGFYESKINNDICIRCEKCRTVCPFVSSKPKKLDAISLFAAYSQNMTILNRSSSGGIAQELADYFNSNGEDVFGCIYNAKTRQAETIRIKSNEKAKLTLLSGSKYLQSNMNGIYQELKSSKGGVFLGTPCQIAAVDLWLRKEHKREKILLVDLICHGVPTYLLWKNYLDEGHKKYHYGENPQVKFRLKKYGWRKMYIYIGNREDKNISYVKQAKKDLFYRFFLAGNCYSNACYECLYRDGSSADIRIGDYWGERFKGNKHGVSMVLPFTEKGKEKLFELKKNNITIFQTNIDDYLNAQQTINFPKPPEYNSIINDFKRIPTSLKKLADKYCGSYEKTNNLIKIINPAIKMCRKYTTPPPPPPRTK